MSQEIQQLEIAIIGAGFSGLCMAINLKKNNIFSFTIFEKAGKLGGTWRDNTYPGAACDIPSILYSFSFEQKSNWQQFFAEQSEIIEYLESCAEKYDLRKHIQFNTEIVRANFDSQKSVWNIYTKSEKHFQVNILIFACGQLNLPKLPDLPGLNTFKGVKFHSARWNHQHNLNEKNIGVIGNGASAIQFIPIVADRAEKLIIFQRSPNWIAKKENRSFSKLEKSIFKTFPQIQSLYRWFVYLLYESRFVLFKNIKAGEKFAFTLENFLDKEVKNDELKSLLKPSYPLGCKRILISEDYYQTLQRSNVELVASPIKSINENQIITKDDRQYLIDTLIFATGFKTNDFLSEIEITGLENKSLKQVWQNGIETYKGILISGFPNLFLLYGPNTNLGHNSVILMIENQVNYIKSCLKLIQKNQLQYLDVKKDVQSKFNRELQIKLAQTVWNSNCTSWYKTDKGKIVNNWPQSTLEYWLICRRANLNKFNWKK